MYARQIPELIRQSAHRAACRRDDLDPPCRARAESAQVLLRDPFFVIKQRSIHVRRDQPDLHIFSPIRNLAHMQNIVCNDTPELKISVAKGRIRISLVCVQQTLVRVYW